MSIEQGGDEPFKEMKVTRKGDPFYENILTTFK